MVCAKRSRWWLRIALHVMQTYAAYYRIRCTLVEIGSSDEALVSNRVASAMGGCRVAPWLSVASPPSADLA